ncbi:hypothetical protein LPN04_29815 [Rugamonas sp. A1-17]|nr:hypothetical protein [Rugamonas sp. A1-17]
MSKQELAEKIQRAIEFAESEDTKHTSKNPHYAVDGETRRMARAECMLSYFSGAIAEAEPALHHALAKLLDMEPLHAKAADAKTQAMQPAASETFSTPAPGAKR